MTWMDRRLGLALGCSLLLHALILAPATPRPAPVRAAAPPLEARLLPPPVPAEQPVMMLPDPPKPAKSEPARRPPKPEKPPAAKAPAARGWVAETGRQMRELDRRGKLYPLEAIARGLEGEAVVLFVLDEAGNVVAARIEQSSGHKILDDAALKAIHTLRALPSDAPREGVYPVRFRLR